MTEEQRLKERTILEAQYMCKKKSTVRKTAEVFGVSKTTVHTDVSERIWEYNPVLARAVRKVLNVNTAERHLRGGMATKEKYSNKS